MDLYKHTHILVLSLLATGLIAGCAVKPRGLFRPDQVPATPDYHQQSAWAALPMTFDSADLVPGTQLMDRQDSARVDVFFVHPTTYTGKRGHNQWNAPIDDQELNERTDKTTIRYQASLFNGVGRVYAPRYRQAHLEAFYTKDRRTDAAKSLDLAYGDVKAAFNVYLSRYNAGRPLIIAAHSQGTAHAGRLLKEYLQDGQLMDQLVVAYLVGMPVHKDFFDKIEVCQTPGQTGCFCSWRTVKEKFYPKRWGIGQDILVTNPLTWTTDADWADAKLHRGAVLKRFDDEPYKEFTSAKISNGYLWIPRPKIPGYLYVPVRNYHVADYNLFYINVRENARLRVETYFEAKS